MLSRVADALYWMGRYLERSENITRLLLVTEDFSSETQGLAEQVAHSAWKDLLAICPSAQVAPPTSAFAPASQAYLTGFFLDPGNHYSVHYSLRRARENARSVREALTVEVFLALNETFRSLETYARRGLSDPPSLRDALSTTHKGLFTIGGAIEHTFTRDQGWLFLQLGTSLERIYRGWPPPSRARTARCTTRSGARCCGRSARSRTTGARTAPGWSRSWSCRSCSSTRTRRARCGTAWKR
jgi:uncharacterized alpha-E superfamily protein